MKLWNAVVEKGNAFSQTDLMNLEEARSFFKEQTFSGVAKLLEKVIKIYILHPNNLGRCGHIANASYAGSDDIIVLGIGEKLAIHFLLTAKIKEFLVMPFNGVVATDMSTIKLYEKLGFIKLGSVTNGFKTKSGNFEDIVFFYIELTEKVSLTEINRML
ncbi:hypothetical protein [Alkalibacter saccharofermentans]|nr:hypothetical protein [Alkalibacter saccharofermentans]